MPKRGPLALREDGITRLALEYLLLVFGAGVGVLQLVAAAQGLKGLSLLSRPGGGYLIGPLLILASFLRFFASADRTKLPVLEGAQQLTLFAVGSLLALAVCLLVPSLLYPQGGSEPPESGLEALQERTYLQAIGQLLRRRGVPRG